MFCWKTVRGVRMTAACDLNDFFSLFLFFRLVRKPIVDEVMAEKIDVEGTRNVLRYPIFSCRC